MSSPSEYDAGLSVDTQAVLLLTAPLGKGENAVNPLTTSEYSALAVALQNEQRRPSDLLTTELNDLVGAILPRLDERTAKTVNSKRLRGLLERGGRLAQAMSRWSSTGIWVSGRADQSYPSRYKRLGRQAAPPIVYGIGRAAAVEAGGLAVVGSRDTDPQIEDDARDAGRWAAKAGIQIVSGAARGVDTIAMTSCAENGGTALGVVADGLLRLSTRREFREHIMNERVTLISSFDPEVSFRPWMAMLRNQWIYALADRALVVAATNGRGGTWTGAIEATKAGVRVYVLPGSAARPGNAGLIARGAIPAPGDLDALWRDERAVSRPAATQLSALTITENDEIYALALPSMLRKLAEPLTAKQFAALNGLTKSQADAWLARLVADGHVQKANATYRSVETHSPQLPLLQ